MVANASNEAAAQASFAILDQLICTLVAKDILTQAEVNSILQRSVDVLEQSKTSSGQLAASFLRQWRLPKQ